MERFFLRIDKRSVPVFRALKDVADGISSNDWLSSRFDEALEQLSGAKNGRLERVVSALELAASQEPILTRSLDDEEAVRIEGMIQDFYDRISILSKPSVEDIANGIDEDIVRVQWVLDNYNVRGMTSRKYRVEGIKKKGDREQGIEDIGENSVRYLRKSWIGQFTANKWDYLEQNGYIDFQGVLDFTRAREKGAEVINNPDLLKTVERKFSVHDNLTKLSDCSETIFVLDPQKVETETIRNVGLAIVSKDKTSLYDLHSETGVQLKYVAAVMVGISRRYIGEYEMYRRGGTITFENGNLIFEFKGPRRAYRF